MTRRVPTIDGRRATMSRLHDYVLAREGGCFALRVDPAHVCQGRRTLEHVTQVHGPEDPRRDDERHCVELCWGLNGGSIASRALREEMRAHLRDLYPTCS